MPETATRTPEQRFSLAGEVVRAARRSREHLDRPSGRVNFAVAVHWASGPFCRDRERPRADGRPVAVISAADELGESVLRSLKVGDSVVVVGRLSHDGKGVLARDVGLSIRLVVDIPEVET